MTDFKTTPLRLLLIEDSEEDTYFLLRELRKANYLPEYKRVQTPESLKLAVMNEQWDIILCDNSMPAMTGREALELVRKDEPTVPFIFVSGAIGPAGGTGVSSVPFVQKGNTGALISQIEQSLARDSFPSIQAHPPRAKNDSSGAPPAMAPTPPKILMVDDCNANLTALEAVLHPLGSTLVRAQSGEEALEKLLKEDFALILLDVRMPGIGGLETADLIHKRARSSSIPIIFLTAGSDNPGEVARAYGAGGVDYLSKPFVPEILRAKVSVFLELWRKNSILERQTAELQSAYESLDAFTSSASHDLKVPLRSIEGYIRLLCEEYEGKVLDRTGADYGRRISQAAHRMKTLIEELLTYAHVGRSETNLVPLDLTEVVDQFLPELKEEIDSRKGRIRVERPLGKVVGHPLLFRQVLANLVTNALKFAVPGHSPQVIIRAAANGRFIRICVVDHGVGISRAEQAKLFKPFVRLSNAEAYPGTGLGLAIVKKAVERMHGQVGIESEIGKGSTFMIDLPCVNPE